MVRADEDVVEHKHKRVVRNAVDADVFGFFRNAVFKQRPVERSLGIVAFLYEGEVRRTCARSRVTYLEAFQSPSVLITLGAETDLEVALEVECGRNDKVIVATVNGKVYQHLIAREGLNGRVSASRRRCL